MQAAQTERKRAEHSVVGYLTGAMSFAVASAPAMADAGADVVTAHLPEQTVTGSAGFKTDEASGGKFTAPLLDTPKSVTVIPAEVLQDSGSVSLIKLMSDPVGVGAKQLKPVRRDQTAVESDRCHEAEDQDRPPTQIPSHRSYRVGSLALRLLR